MSDIGFEEEEFSTSLDRGTIWRIALEVKQHWKWVLGFMLSVGWVSALDSYFTYLSKRIIDEAIVPGQTAALTPIVTIYGAMIMVQVVGVLAFIYLAGVLGQRVQYELRKKMFDHLQTLSFSYYDRTPVGWIMSRLTSDTERIADLVTWGLLDITWAIMNIITASVFMFIINWQLALMVYIMIPILIVIGVWFKGKILVEYRQARKTNSKITGTYNENITGVRVVKALGREAENLKEFGVLTDEMYRSSFRAAWLSARVAK